MSTYQGREIPSLKYFIKPFQCKIWTNYVSDPGYGVKIYLGAENAIIDGNIINPENPDIVITKDDPINIQATFGVVRDLYRPPVVVLQSAGCSPFDSHCTPTTNPIVYISCDLTK